MWLLLLAVLATCCIKKKIHCQEFLTHSENCQNESGTRTKWWSVSSALDAASSQGMAPLSSARITEAVFLSLTLSETKRNKLSCSGADAQGGCEGERDEMSSVSHSEQQG